MIYLLSYPENMIRATARPNQSRDSLPFNTSSPSRYLRTLVQHGRRHGSIKNITQIRSLGVDSPTPVTRIAGCNLFLDRFSLRWCCDKMAKRSIVRPKTSLPYLDMEFFFTHLHTGTRNTIWTYLWNPYGVPTWIFLL